MKKITKLIPIILCISPCVVAKNVSLDLLVATGESDNALKSQERKISEKQNRYTAALGAAWDKQWMIASMQYTAYEETFADNSQEGQNYLQGDSSLILGNSSNLFNLDLRHSRRALLKDSSDLPVVSNQEEREIFSVKPSARFDVTGSDELIAYAEMFRTRYLETELRDSDRNVYGVDHHHRFTSADMLNIHLKKTETDFVYFPQANYSLHSAILVYSVTLRKLSYSLGAGQNKTEPEFGDTQNSPYYEASVGYKRGVNQVRFFADQTVTDSSYGQGAGVTTSSVPGVDASFNEVALMERKRIGVNLARKITARCTFTLGVNKTDDSYLISSSESTQTGGLASIQYSFSPRANFSLTHSVSDIEGLAVQVNDSYKQSFSRYSFRYQFLRSFDVEFFREKEKRSSNSGRQDYTENFTGVSLGYHFE